MSPFTSIGSVRMLAGLLGLWLLAAGTVAHAQQPMLLPVDPAPLVVDGGGLSFSIEVADDPVERSAGLMYRRIMPDNRGMLFVFETTRQVGFWMKNTPLPLDLIFIGEDGEVKAVMHGVPFSEASISPGADVRFVLELKAGTAQKAGIAKGVRLRHPRIDEIAGD